MTLLPVVAWIGQITSSSGPHFLLSGVYGCVCECGVSWVLSWEAGPWRVSLGKMGEETARISSDHHSGRAGVDGRVVFQAVATKMEAGQKPG